MGSSLGNRCQMILSKALHFATTVDATVSIMLFDGIPLRCRQVILECATNARLAFFIIRQGLLRILRIAGTATRIDLVRVGRMVCCATGLRFFRIGRSPSRGIFSPARSLFLSHNRIFHAFMATRSLLSAYFCTMRLCIRCAPHVPRRGIRSIAFSHIGSPMHLAERPQSVFALTAGSHQRMGYHCFTLGAVLLDGMRYLVVTMRALILHDSVPSDTGLGKVLWPCTVRYRLMIEGSRLPYQRATV